MKVNQLTSPAQPEAHTTSSIPEFSLALTCGRQNDPHPYRLTPEEKESLAGFVTFVEDHQDSLVYLNVRIDQECASCGCPRAARRDDAADGSDDAPDAPRGTLRVDARSAAARAQTTVGEDTAKEDAVETGWGGARMFEEGLLLEVNGVEGWVVGNAIYLPRWRHLSDAQYRAGEYGTFAKFDGLFTARFHGRTGVNMLHLDVVSPSSRELSQLRSIRQRRSALDGAPD